MYPLLYKFLMINHHVGIPGVGNFYIENSPAQFDFINKVFHAPTYQVNFSAEGLAAEKKFYSFVAHEKNVSELQAIQLFNDFAFTLKNNILNEQSVELPGIGKLQKGEYSKIEFSPFPQSGKYLPDVSAMPIISKSGKEHFITVGDQQRTNTQQLQEYMEEEQPTNQKQYWWIFAILLGLGAIAAIVYYYYIHGSLR